MKVKLSSWFRRLLYLGLSISFFTGIMFYYLNRWVTLEGEFGPEKHPLQFTLLQTHGAAAFIMLMVFGAMFSNHIPLSWRTKRLRVIGLTLTALIVIQIVSAYLLYYVSEEYIRSVISTIHLILGLILPVVLIVHLLIGRKRTRFIRG